MSLHKKFNISWASIIYLALMFATIGFISIMAAVPPVSRDALTYHLAVPKLYLHHGGMYEMPHFEHSYFPMNLDLLYLIPLYFKNDIIPKYIHFTFAALTAFLIYVYLKRRLNSEHALLGALLFLSIPVVITLSSTVYVDLGLTFFLFASMLTLFHWIQTDFQIRPLFMSALYCGLALGTKYNGLIGLFLLTLFIPYIYSRYKSLSKHKDIKAIGHAVFFSFIAILVFSPWLMRNFMWTGNPLHPLYSSIFEKHIEVNQLNDNNIFQKIKSDNRLYYTTNTTGTENDATMFCADVFSESPQMNHFQIRRYVYGESGLEIMLIPIRIFFQGKDDDPKYFDGKANPFLMLLPIFAFFGLKSDTPFLKREKTILLFFSVLYLLFVFAQTDMRIRYIAPILPPLVVLSVFGLYNFKKILIGPNIHMTAVLAKVIVSSIIITMLLINGLYLVKRYEYVRPFDYLSGTITRDDYIQKYRPEYASYQYANQHLQTKDKILAIFVGDRGYYLDVDVIFDVNRLRRLAGICTTPEQIFLTLHNDGISHLLINYELFNLYVNQYDYKQKIILKAFVDNHAFRVFSRDGYGLYQLQRGPIDATDQKGSQ